MSSSDYNKYYNKHVRPEYKKKFYNGAKWKRVRQSVLKRDKYACQRCKYYFKNTPAEIVHHIKPFEDYPELKYKMSNLVSVCRACHNTIHYKKDSDSRYSNKRNIYTKR